MIGNTERLQEYIKSIPIRPLGMKEVVLCSLAIDTVSIACICGICLERKDAFSWILVFFFSCTFVLTTVAAALYPLRKKEIYFFSWGLICFSLGAVFGNGAVLLEFQDNNKYSHLYMIIYISICVVLMVCTILLIRKRILSGKYGKKKVKFGVANTSLIIAYSGFIWNYVFQKATL